MKLAKITDEVIGLVVALPNGPHIVDIAKSVGVFAPHDPLSNGLLKPARSRMAVTGRRLSRTGRICSGHSSGLLSSWKPAQPTRACSFNLLSIGI